MTIGEYFQQLREDEDYHLGMGDIRLTKAMQDEIAAVMDGAGKALAVSILTNLSSPSNSECMDWAWEELDDEWQDRMIFARTKAIEQIERIASFGEDRE